MFKIHVGDTLTVLNVYNGENSRGPYQSAKLDSGDKPRQTLFIDPPIANLHEDDVVQIDDITYQVSYDKNSNSYKPTVRLTCHLANPGFGGGKLASGGFNPGGFDAGSNTFDPGSEEELPF